MSLFQFDQYAVSSRLHCLNESVNDTNWKSKENVFICSNLLFEAKLQIFDSTNKSEKKNILKTY